MANTSITSQVSLDMVGNFPASSVKATLKIDNSDHRRITRPLLRQQFQGLRMNSVELIW